jgi:hypothetical protein
MLEARQKNQILGNCWPVMALMLAVVPAATCQAISGQENAPATVDVAADNAGYRKISLNRLRKEFYSAEEKFYATFNSINSTDEFDVDCKDEVQFGRGGKVHACKASFLRKYESRLASKYSRRMSRIGDDALPSESEIDAKQEQLRKEISAAIDENPDMKKRYAELVQAKKDYEARQLDP